MIDDIEISGDEYTRSMMESDNSVTLDRILLWKDGAGSPLRPVYTKDSRTTAWRRDCKKQRRDESVKAVAKITFFSP
jgi:hypothetical protein